MKFKKPNFWDYKKPNLFAYILLPFAYIIKLINFISKKEKITTEKIKTICIGNLPYVVSEEDIQQITPESHA